MVLRPENAPWLCTEAPNAADLSKKGYQIKRVRLPLLRQNEYLHCLLPLLFVLSELFLELLLCWFEVLLLLEDF